MEFEKFQFANLEVFWILLVLPLLVLWYILNKNKQLNTLRVSSVKGFKGARNILPKLKALLFALRLLVILLIIIALAAPRIENLSVKSKSTRGIDIVMAVDASSSMLANDLKPNRLEALKSVAIEFVNQRTNDRVGVVVYAAESYTKTPVTSDKGIVIGAIKNITYGNLEDGTAIGMGLSTAVNRLKNSKAKSKVIILLTDGVNNSGFVDPETATELALEYQIKVYTIGIGTNGMAKTPIAYNPDGTFRFGLRKVEIDESLLKLIAKKTNGKYFRAKDNRELKAIYNEIDKLEKTELEEVRYFNYEKEYRPFVIMALILMSLDLVLRYTFFKSFI